MRRTGLVAAALLAAVPAFAGGAGTASRPDAELGALIAPRAWLEGMASEADIELVFGYLRAALAAAARGEALAPPPELARRADALARELERRGVRAGQELLDLLEQGAKRALREALAPDPGR